ncbi:MAG: GC-type dockerin domain-anchored protein [Phycisphaerales bacterium]
MRTAATACAALLAAAGASRASPQETATFTNINSNGVLNHAANSVQLRTFNGGYTLGRIDLSGTLTSVHPNTWRSDSRIVITAPHGQSVVFQAFPAGGTFTTLSFSGSVYLPPGTDAAGQWSLRFYEFFDDGGSGLVDARWSFTLTLTDEPPAPPASTDLGTLTAAGLSGSAPMSVGQVRWFRFALPEPVPGGAGRFADLDTFGSTIAAGSGFANDTTIGLYDSAGARVARDDDSCDGFLSQLTFGAGTRPPVGDGLPFDGRNGPLAQGTYYLAVATYPSVFGAQRWEVSPGGTQSGTVAVRLRAGVTTSCYPNCDESTALPVLNVADFGCFLTRYAAGDPYANCDGSTTAPVLNVQDFGCFLTRYATGCP